MPRRRNVELRLPLNRCSDQHGPTATMAADPQPQAANLRVPENACDAVVAQKPNGHFDVAFVELLVETRAFRFGHHSGPSAEF